MSKEEITLRPNSTQGSIIYFIHYCYIFNKIILYFLNSEENMEIVSPSVAAGRTFLTLAREGSNFASNTSLNSIGANIMTESSPPRGLYPFAGQPHFALTSNNSSSTIVANDVSLILNKDVARCYLGYNLPNCKLEKDENFEMKTSNEIYIGKNINIFLSHFFIHRYIKCKKRLYYHNFPTIELTFISDFTRF